LVGGRFRPTLATYTFSALALELGDRGRAPLDGLADLEAFELRMVDVERLVLARIPVGGAEFG
jgi:hypothetical protein